MRRGEHPDHRQPRCCLQAIAKAEAVSGNAARLAGTPTPCLCKRPRQDEVTARILFVQTKRATGSEPGARIVYLSGSDGRPVRGSLDSRGDRNTT
jgi:hypothetical protein